MTEVSDSACANLDEMNAREVLAELFSDAHTAYTFTDEPVTDQQLHATNGQTQHAPSRQTPKQATGRPATTLLQTQD